MTVGPVKDRGSGAWQCRQINLVKAVRQYRRLKEGWQMNNVIRIQRILKYLLFVKMIRHSRWDWTCGEEFSWFQMCCLHVISILAFFFSKFFSALPESFKCVNKEFNSLNIEILHIITYNIYHIPINPLQNRDEYLFSISIYCLPKDRNVSYWLLMKKLTHLHTGAHTATPAGHCVPTVHMLGVWLEVMTIWKMLMLQYNANIFSWQM